MNCLRCVIRADDRLLSVDSALGVYARHRLRRGSTAVQLVSLPAGSGKRGVRASIVADADISGDPITCEMAIIPFVRIGVVLVRRALARVAV